MSGQKHIFEDPKATAAACAEHIVAKLADASAGGSPASLAISGGSTPKLMFEAFTRMDFDWSRVHLFWVDERGVPPDHEQSNYRLANESFLVPVKYPAKNVHRVLAELRPEVAAERYVADIRAHFGLTPGEFPHFDVVHQGMGSDAHTASLFPGEPLINDRQTIAAAVYSEKMQQWRITFSPETLISANHTVMLVNGPDKVVPLRHVLHDAYAPLEYPTQLIAHNARDVVWYLDKSASGGLEA